MQKTIAKTLMCLGFAAAAAPLAIAQTATPPAGTPPARHAPQERHAFSLPSERVEAQLAYEKTALKITGAQQAQWDAYADVRRKQAREMDQSIEALRAQRASMPREQRPTAIERLERGQQRLAAALQRANELLAVEKPLYAALTPEQQKVADRILAPRGHGAPHGRGGHRGA
jgi:hypothetical protein